MTYATVADSLRLHGEFEQSDFDGLIDHWGRLDSRLRSFGAGTVHLDLYLKDRDRPGQHLILEAKIERLPPLVATTSDSNLGHGLNVVRDEMVRLITDALDQHNPRRRARRARRRE